ARAAALQLENERAAVLATAWGSQNDPPEKLTTVVLRREEELAEFVPWNLAGFTAVGPDWSLVVVVGSGPSDRPVAATLAAHELTHGLSRYFLRRQQRWLAEGLAGFLGAAR